MSITFFVATEKLELYDDKVVIETSPLYPPDFDRTYIVDVDFPEYGALPPDNPWELNLSNANAMMILRLLGFGNDNGIIGELDKFIGACQSILATCRNIPEIDNGTPAEILTGDNGCMVIECGIREGYINDRVSQLMELARIAKVNDAVLVYS